MCYGMNCEWEGSNGTCDFIKDFPCNEPEKIIKTKIIYQIYTSLEKEIEHSPDEDPEEILMDYFYSDEFKEDLKEGLTEGKLEWNMEVVESDKV